MDSFNEWSEARREKILKQYKNLNQDEFSRDKTQEIRCINGKDSIIVNPIIEWIETDVWEFLNKVMEVPHCELYDPPYNRHRIGCILCPMSSYKSKLRDIELYPYAKRNWVQTIEKMLRNAERGDCGDESTIKFKGQNYEWRTLNFKYLRDMLKEIRKIIPTEGQEAKVPG